MRISGYIIHHRLRVLPVGFPCLIWVPTNGFLTWRGDFLPYGLKERHRRLSHLQQQSGGGEMLITEHYTIHALPNAA